MALRQETIDVGRRHRSRPSKKASAFRTHLAVYLGVGVFLFTLNLLTSPFHLWFYWPMFFWGWALVIHAFATYGTDAPWRALDDLRSLVPGMSNALPAPPVSATGAVAAAPFAAEAFAAVHERIERLKELAWQIPDGPARERAIGICETADQIAASLAADRADAATVNGFAADVLAPAESLFSQIVHAANHGAPGADVETRRLAEHDLALLQSRLDALSERMPRGRVVEPSVTATSFGVEPSAPRGVPLRSQP
jgi:hypothetical protein